MNKTQYIIDAFAGAGISIDEATAERFAIYEEALVERNKEVNLTAITDFEEVVLKHFVDSAAPLITENVSRETFGLIKACNTDTDKIVSRETICSIIDIGTGAGFPGIPLGILIPGARLTLLDSLTKRVTFLGEMINALKLTDAQAIHSRAEDGARTQLRDGFDIAVSRAVARLSVLCEYDLPYVKVGGYFIAYKAGDCEEEVKEALPAIKKLGGTLMGVRTLLLPGSDIKRSLIYIKKDSPTPKAYPRRAGTPEKKPLS